MPYQDFIISSALKKFKIKKIAPNKAEYIIFFEEFTELGKFKQSNTFLDLIGIALEEYHDSSLHSEMWLRNNLISPFLGEIKKSYKSLFVWEGVRLEVDKEKGLSGEPDYFVTKRAEGYPEVPYCILGEAKKDNFEKGWGQCLAGMVAAQILNKNEFADIPIYGVVSSGIDWEFGKLIENKFSIYPNGKLSALKEDDRNNILTILNIIFAKCEGYIKED